VRPKAAGALMWAIRAGWLVLSLYLLMWGASAWSNAPEPRRFHVEEGVAWGLLVLNLPSSIGVLVLIIGVLALVDVAFGLAAPAGMGSLLITWLLFSAVGYVQWFVVLPLRRASTSPPSPRATTLWWPLVQDRLGRRGRTSGCSWQSAESC